MLSVDDFGRWSVLGALFATLLPLTDLGTQIVSVREANKPSAGPSDFGGIVRLRLLLAAAGSAVAVAVAVLVSPGMAAAVAMICAGAIGLSFVGSLWGWLAAGGRIIEAFTLDAAARSTGSLIVIPAGILGVGATLNTVAGLVYGPLLVWGIASAAVLTPVFRQAHAGLGSALGKTWLYGVVTLVSVVHFRADIFLVSYLLGPGSAAVYGLAYRPFELAVSGAQLVALPAYLVWVRTSGGPSAGSHHWMATAGAGAGMALLMLAGPLTSFLGGSSDYTGAEDVLRTLAAAMPAAFVIAFCGYSLLLVRREGRLLVVVSASAAVNLILNVVFLPVVGYGAAAMATVATESAAALLLLQSTETPSARWTSILLIVYTALILAIARIA
jgi:O-antigen/teichoic acid export membrane protein